MSCYNRKNWVWVFLGLETFLYIHLMITSQAWSMFGSVLLCFVFALVHQSKDNRFIVIGLAFTVAADTCLVLCQPQQRLLGMLFFLIVQCFYAFHLQSKRQSFRFLMIRLGLVMTGELIALWVLGNKADALALISLAYYANMVSSIIEGSAQFSRNKLLPIGLVLFLLCDTVIGLQVAAENYLAITADSLLHQLLYPGFNLAWLFYLPSQVLITLSITTHHR